MLRNKKAVSNTIAALLLIAISIIITIAVMAWAGMLTFSYMEVEEILISDVRFVSGDIPTIQITLHNIGDAIVVVQRIYINDYVTTEDIRVRSKSFQDVEIPYNWASGTRYEIQAETSSGNKVIYKVTAP